MNPPRIAYLVSQYPTVHHTFILREIRSLRDLGVDVEVISISDPDRDLSAVSEIEADEQRGTRYVKRVGVVSALLANLSVFIRRPVRYSRVLASGVVAQGFRLGNAFRSILYFVEAVIVGRWLQQSRVTRVHCHFSTNVGLPAARLFDLDLSMTIHGPTEFDDPIAFRMRDKIETASLVVAISQFARSQIMRNSDNSNWPKIEVIPLGIDPQEFVPRQPPGGTPIEIICVGRLAGIKAQQILIAAFKQLVDSGRDVLLRLVGDGEDRAHLESIVRELNITDRVVFEGWLNQDQVQDRLRRADIFALASFAEGVPVVLMEAMAMEIPCVSTWVNGIPELIRDRVDGLLVPPSDATELANAIDRLIEDQTLRQSIAQAGRQRVIEKYDLSKNVPRLSHRLQGTEAE